MNRTIAIERARLGMTKGDLSKHMGVARQTISEWEKGDLAKTSATNITKLADLFGVTTDYLLGRVEERI